MIKAVMFQFILAFGFILLPIQSNAQANEGAENVFAAFEFFCLELSRSKQMQLETLKNVGAIELPKEKARVFLAPRKGRAWYIKPAKKAQHGFIITLTKKNVCTVSAPRSNGPAVLKLFKKHTRNIKTSEENIGSQMVQGFAVSHDDQFQDGTAHIMVIITTTPLFNAEGIILNAIPESIMRADKIPIPKWPQ